VKGLPHLRDLSNWQGPVDWRQEKRNVVAAYVKVSEGLTFVDPTGARRIRNATYAGIRAVGGYHFCTPGVGSGEQQADRLLSLAPVRPGRLRPALDLETNPNGLTPGQLAAWALGAVTRIRERLGCWPVIYGSPAFLEPFCVIHPEVFGRCPLWVANYGVDRPRVPAPWTSWAAWQWTPGYRDPAIRSGAVDDSYVADLPALTVPASSALAAARILASRRVRR